MQVLLMAGATPIGYHWVSLGIIGYHWVSLGIAVGFLLSGIANNGRLRTFLNIFLPSLVLLMPGATPVGIAIDFLLSGLTNMGASCISALAAGAALFFCPFPVPPAHCVWRTQQQHAVLLCVRDIGGLTAAQLAAVCWFPCHRDPHCTDCLSRCRRHFYLRGHSADPAAGAGGT